MFKSIQYRLVFIFTLVVLSVIVVAGVFFKMAITDFYLSDFNTRMNLVFSSDEMKNQINEAVIRQDESVERLSSIITLYSWQFGIDKFRNAFLLGSTGRVLYSTDKKLIDNFEITSNIISAINGKNGNDIQTMDFAFPVLGENGEVAYVIYIKDSKEELSGITDNITTIILKALGIGLIISTFLGFFMSKTITGPIVSLTHKAKQIAEGDFETRISVVSKDEIGKLSITFNNMARELKETLSAIEGEKNKLETILLFMTDGVMAFDSEGGVLHINQAAKKMLSIEDSETIQFDTFFNEINANISRAELLFKKNEIVQREMEVGKKNIKAFFATSINDDDRLESIVVMLHDITEQQKLELARREFVANVSHELRTPITTIKSYTETILETEDLPEDMRKDFLGVISSEADRMTRLVRDLLVLSRLDYGKNMVKKEEFDITTLIREILRKLSLAAKENEHTLSFTPTTEIPLFYGDRDRIEQVIINIVSNAIKYTPCGGKIEIFSGKLYNHIFIKIKDNGIGIPKGDLRHIFDRFYRVDKARSRESGGTGLGLAIAKEIVEAHGGTISIISQPEEGTEVQIKLPI